MRRRRGSRVTGGGRVTEPDLTVTIFEGGATLVVEVAGYAGHRSLWLALTDNGFRTLWPVRGMPARLPERPARRGEMPALGAILRAVMEGGA